MSRRPEVKSHKSKVTSQKLLPLTFDFRLATAGSARGRKAILIVPILILFFPSVAIPQSAPPPAAESTPAPAAKTVSEPGLTEKFGVPEPTAPAPGVTGKDVAPGPAVPPGDEPIYLNATDVEV